MKQWLKMLKNFEESDQYVINFSKISTILCDKKSRRASFTRIAINHSFENWTKRLIFFNSLRFFWNYDEKIMKKSARFARTFSSRA